MKVRIEIKSIKDEEKLEKLVEALTSMGVSVSDFFRSLNSAKAFTFNTHKSLYDANKSLLDETCDYRVVDINQSIGDYGFTAISLLDTFIVFYLFGFFVDGLKLREVLSEFFSSSIPIWSLVSLGRVLLAFIFYLGFLEALQTTPAGYLFKIKLSEGGNVRIFIAFMLLPIVGLVLASSPFGLWAKLLGIFLVVFFISASLSGVLTTHYQLRFEKV